MQKKKKKQQQQQQQQKEKKRKKKKVFCEVIASVLYLLTENYPKVRFPGWGYFRSRPMRSFQILSFSFSFSILLYI